MKNYQTPCYFIHEKKLNKNISTFRDSFSQEWGGSYAMGYSIKTNHLPWLIRYAYRNSLFAEAVSDDEFHLAICCGVPPERIILNGPQKSAEVLKTALRAKGIINVDNFEEIHILSELIGGIGFSTEEKESLQIGLRVNFDLEAVCPGETTAGNSVSRFGFCLENGALGKAIEKLHALGIKISGFHMHYSTKTRSSAVFRALAQEVCELVQEYHLEDEISFIDMGGGFFGGRTSDIHPSPKEYARIIVSTLKLVLDPQKVKLIIEPGASILATAIDYRSRVQSVRQIRGVNVVTLDGTSLHINPFQVKRQPVYMVQKEVDTEVQGRQVVCGNTCMENDRFFESDYEPLLSVGDEIIFQYAGAYTMSFNSCFIHVPPAVYLLDNQDKVTCIRDRVHGLMMKN